MQPEQESKLVHNISDMMNDLLSAFADQMRDETRRELGRLEQRLTSGDPLQTVALDDTNPTGSASELNDRAVHYFYRNQLDESVKLLEQAVMQEPTLTAAWSNLAMVNSALNRTEKAIKSFQKALELSPQQTELLNNQAVLTMLKGNPGDALAMLEEARRNHDQDVSVLLNLAQAYQAVGDEGKAVEVWKQVLHIDPEQPEANRCLRQFYE